MNGHRVLTGTCSWTDATLVKEADWYPKRSMKPAERLAFYAKHFRVVEVDGTYYSPPREQVAASWAERTPDGFVFDIKAYSLLTGHPTRPSTLWPDLREAIDPEHRDKRNLYADHLAPDALEEAWRRFAAALEPLREAGKLGAVLFQYPEWFTPRRDNREELARLRERLPDLRISVELRSPRWTAERSDRERTLKLLGEHDLTYVAVDAPQVSGLPRLPVATTDLAIMRFHGRADDTWKKPGLTAAERFRYLYSGDEIDELAKDAKRLAGEAAETHLLMNNCYRDYAVRNAQDLLDRLQ